jgi:ankyrin repeat protein
MFKLCMLGISLSSVLSVCAMQVPIQSQLDKELLRAVLYRNLPEVKEALAQGACLGASDRYGNTVLHSYTLPEIFSLLIEAGADVNAENERNKTPLSSCASPNLMSILLKAGATKGATESLCWAIIFDYTDLVELLLAAGADANANKIGLSGLSFAIYKGNSKSVELLLKAGARPTQANYDEALQTGDQAVTNLLLDYKNPIRRVSTGYCVPKEVISEIASYI